MPSTSSLSRRRLLALSGGSLVVGAAGGYVASGGLGAHDERDPSPHAVVTAERGLQALEWG